MRKIFFGALALAALPLLSSPASAWTCKDRMDACWRIAKNPSCYEKQRCQAGLYYAPSGKTWQVNGIKHVNGGGGKK